MNQAPIRIILVDDHKIVRDAWKMMLGQNPRFQLIAECKDGKSAIEKAQELVPDIMLVDVNMSPINGFDVTRSVHNILPAIKIIGVSVNNEPKYASSMIKSGAMGYLTKTSPVEEINEGIIKVFNGEVYICEEIRKNNSLSK